MDRVSGLDPASGTFMDANMSKQMAALNAVSQARMANRSFAGNGISSGGINTPNLPGPLLDTSMSRPGQPGKMQSQNFLQSVASFMVKRNTPLPPALTGYQTPTYDSQTSHFQVIECGSEIGSFRLAGRDVELLKLWSQVFQQGGSQVVTANNLWNGIAAALELPEESPASLPGNVSIAQTLQSYYQAILQPFEEMYRRKMSEQQKRAQTLKPAIISPSSTSSPSTNQASSSIQAITQEPHSKSHGSTDQDADGLKRKTEGEEAEGKRARQRVESEIREPPPTSDSTDTNKNGPSSGPQPAARTRRKIEYIPYAREVDTYGGRDFRQLEVDFNAPAHRRPVKDLNEWGIVDVEHLTMSIRSRLSTELSYALTTFTLLSTLKGQNPGSGFAIHRCPDLLDEVLDLLEERAFGGEPDALHAPGPNNELRIATNRELVTLVTQTETELFAGLTARQGSKDPKIGPRQRPGAIILTILNIIRNLSIINENLECLSRHRRLLGLLLRLSTVTYASPTAHPTPTSHALSVSDLIIARRDALYILSYISPSIQFIDASGETARVATRIFELTAAYLIDPLEAVSPSAVASRGPITGNLKPPSTADIALEILTKIVHLDSNKQVFGKTIPRASLLQLFCALVHRLPLLDLDFQLVLREQWLSYLEKLMIALYCIAFLLPPSAKLHIKNDRQLGFKDVMLRMVQRFNATQESRAWFYVCSRRAIETMKVLDDCQDCFDTSKATSGPTMAFGMGYGEIGESTEEHGTGWLGGHRELAWDLLMLREFGSEEPTFGELESLARVDISA